MPNADYSKPFLPVAQIAKLLELVIKAEYTHDVLIDDAIKLLHKDRQTISNSLGLLFDIGLISSVPTGTFFASPIDDASLRELILTRLSEDHVISAIAKALRPKNPDDSRDINQYKLFPKYRGVLSLTTSLGIVTHDSDRNAFIVLQDQQGYFEGFDEESDLSKYEKGLSPDQLHQQQLAQNERGEAAEEFVLANERARLRGHPNIDAVKRISLTNVSAGFDIQSFDSIHSTTIDRFIEVKSFVGEPGFYWSINEIKFAQKKGTQYCLAIVSSAKMSNPDYTQSEIRNPFDVFQMDRFIAEHSEGAFEISPMNFYIHSKE